MKSCHFYDTMNENTYFFNLLLRKIWNIQFFHFKTRFWNTWKAKKIGNFFLLSCGLLWHNSTKKIEKITVFLWFFLGWLNGTEQKEQNERFKTLKFLFSINDNQNKTNSCFSQTNSCFAQTKPNRTTWNWKKLNRMEQNRIKVSISRTQWNGTEQNIDLFFSYLPWHGIAKKRASNNVLVTTT